MFLKVTVQIGVDLPQSFSIRVFVCIAFLVCVNHADKSERFVLTLKVGPFLGPIFLV